MATRLQFENNCDIGAFSKLTNAYCMVAIGGSEGFYSVFESELSGVILVTTKMAHKLSLHFNHTSLLQNRITTQRRMRNYITYATTLFHEKGSEEIILKAMGRAINKTVTITELIKRRIVDLPFEYLSSRFPLVMATRLQFENNCDIGAFSKLTNAYCMVAIGGSEGFYSVFESELSGVILVVKTSVAGTRIVGRLCAGNKNGLLLPHTTTDQELQHFRNSLPDQTTKMAHKLSLHFNHTSLFQNRITTQRRMRNYITYATTLFHEKGSEEIILKAMGRAINKTVTITELIKRRIVGLHQNTVIGSTDITDTWEPLEEGLLPLETTRHCFSLSNNV
ncbi:hypothetical protein RYX36_028156 [Vicia faba]